MDDYVSPTNSSVNVFSTQALILDTTLLNDLFTASAGKGTDISVWSSEPYAVPFSVLCCFKTLCDLGIDIEPASTHSVSFYRLELHKLAAVMDMFSRQIFICGGPAPLPLPQSPAPYSFTTIFYSFISSRIFDNVLLEKAQNIRTLRIFVGSLLSWLVSSSNSVPEVTCHGIGRGLHVNP